MTSGSGVGPRACSRLKDDHDADSRRLVVPAPLPEPPPNAHHVEIYRDDATGQWGAQCLTCGFDQGGYLLFTTADSVAGEHHDQTTTPSRPAP